YRAVAHWTTGFQKAGGSDVSCHTNLAEALLEQRGSHRRTADIGRANDEDPGNLLLPRSILKCSPRRDASHNRAVRRLATKAQRKPRRLLRSSRDATSVG